MIAMNMSVLEKAYYDRHLKLAGFGEQAQRRLQAAKVLVIGAGGLGCPVLQYLVTAGVGEIGIVDGDYIAHSNLHRQLLYNRHDVGQSKAKVAAERLRQLQPNTLIHAYTEHLNSRNALVLLSQYDLIIDGTDNFATRYLVNDACVMANKPLVSGAIHDYQGQVSVFNYKNGPTYRCLYPDALLDDHCGNCSLTGVLNVLPGIVGVYMANEAIKLITEYGDVLSGKLLCIDIQKNTHQLLNFELVPANKQITHLNQHITLLHLNDVHLHQVTNPEIQLVDVREAWEFDEWNIGGINIPVYAIPTRKGEIDRHKPVIFICQTGKKSRLAHQLLQSYLRREVYYAKMDNGY